MFTRWCNEHLEERGLLINNIAEDFRDGILLCNLLEIISGKSLGNWNRKPRSIFQRYENTALALHFISGAGIRTVKFDIPLNPHQ